MAVGFGLGGDDAAPERRVRSAIYIDFDNVFSGLMDLDEQAAMAFAQCPGDWLDRLRDWGLASGVRRDFLIRRCYMNPSGVKPSKTAGPNGKLYFSKLRPFLTRAGFVVVDCPSLTYRSKNASDIRIVIDVLDALNHSTRFDEFILFSGDADFTPLLQRVREHDRQTVVASSSQAAKAYEATVDTFLVESDVIELVRPEKLDSAGVDASGAASLAASPLATVAETPPLPAGGPTATGAPEADLPSNGHGPATHPGTSASGTPHRLRPDLEGLRQRAIDATLAAVAAADDPVPLPALASAIRDEVGSAVDATHWFGLGSLSTAITDPRTQHLRRSQHHIWDPARHDLPPAIDNLARVTGMPRLSRGTYRAVFAHLARTAAEDPADVTTMTQQAREHLHASGVEVGRNPLAFIVRGAMYGGVPLDRKPPPAAVEIAAGFLQSVIGNAESSQLELGDDDRVTIEDWLLPDPAEVL